MPSFSFTYFLERITWKGFLITLLVLFLASTAIYYKIEGLTHQKQLNALKREKKVQLDNKEATLNETITKYENIIADKNALITLKERQLDSVDVELAQKDKRIEKINDEIQLLAGDSLAILDALDRAFSR